MCGKKIHLVQFDVHVYFGWSVSYSMGVCREPKNVGALGTLLFGLGAWRSVETHPPHAGYRAKFVERSQHTYGDPPEYWAFTSRLTGSLKVISDVRSLQNAVMRLISAVPRHD